MRSRIAVVVRMASGLALFCAAGVAAALVASPARIGRTAVAAGAAAAIGGLAGWAWSGRRARLAAVYGGEVAAFVALSAAFAGAAAIACFAAGASRQGFALAALAATVELARRCRG